MKKIEFAKYLIVISVVLFCSGCAGPQLASSTTKYDKNIIATLRMPQSHYTYPNSNVIPLGQATGKSHKTGTIDDFPNMGAALTEAMDNAIKTKNDADLLINAMTSAVLTTTTTTRQGKKGQEVDIKYDLDVTVSGTAAKMEIGKQILK